MCDASNYHNHYDHDYWPRHTTQQCWPTLSVIISATNNVHPADKDDQQRTSDKSVARLVGRQCGNHGTLADMLTYEK